MLEPFGAFIMSEFHADTVEQIVRDEELSAVPGQVECLTLHTRGHVRIIAGERAGTHEVLPMDGPCPACGAAV